MDAEIQAMEGNQQIVQVLDPGNLPTHSFPSVYTKTPVIASSLPSLDAGFRHPCRNDGFLTFVYNDEPSRSGTSLCVAPDAGISCNGEAVARPTQLCALRPFSHSGSPFLH